MARFAHEAVFDGVRRRSHAAHRPARASPHYARSPEVPVFERHTLLGTPEREQLPSRVRSFTGDAAGRAGPPGGADHAGERTVRASTLEFAAEGDRRMPARLWRPEADGPGLDGPRPGVVFVCEAFGLTAEMERLARMVASWGYVVLAPDLFAQGTWLGCLRRLIRDLGQGGGGSAETLCRARVVLAAQPGVDPARLGVLGFCLGGGYALLLAQRELFEVAAAFYGDAPTRMDGACPVVASYGGRDRVLGPQAPKLRAELERVGVAHDVKVYPGAGHAFMNDAPNPVLGFLARHSPVHAGYDAAAAADAAARVRRFLAVHLDRTPA